MGRICSLCGARSVSKLMFLAGFGMRRVRRERSGHRRQVAMPRLCVSALRSLRRGQAQARVCVGARQRPRLLGVRCVCGSSREQRARGHDRLQHLPRRCAAARLYKGQLQRVRGAHPEEGKCRQCVSVYLYIQKCYTPPISPPPPPFTDGDQYYPASQICSADGDVLCGSLRDRWCMGCQLRAEFGVKLVNAPL